MLLCDKDIYKALHTGKIVICGLDTHHTFNPVRQIQPASVDLRLGNIIKRYSAAVNSFDVRDIQNIDRLFTREIVEDGQGICLKPNEVVYGQIYEHIYIDDSISAMVEGRSRMARLGISIHCTGSFINPGFCGAIPLQLVNHNPFSITLYPYMSICQMFFSQLTDEPLIKYGDRTQEPGNPYQNEAEASLSVASVEDETCYSTNVISERISTIVENYNSVMRNDNGKIVDQSKEEKLCRGYISSLKIGEFNINMKEIKIGNITGRDMAMNNGGDDSVVTQSINNDMQQIDFEKVLLEIKKINSYLAEQDLSDATNRSIAGKVADIQLAAQDKSYDRFKKVIDTCGKAFLDICKSLGCSLLLKYI